jgi:hypothetical protein
VPLSSDKIIDDLKNHKENLPPGFLDDFHDYKNIFVQRFPRYATKKHGGKNWRTKPRSLSDPPVLAHLLGKYDVGVLGRWYPEFLCIDIDDQPIEFVYHLRGLLRLDENNSMLYPSESPDSYHLYGSPLFNGKPPTIKLLHNCLKSFAKEHNIEIYPQANRVGRLAFSPFFNSLDPCYYHLDSWREELYYFHKLDEFDISRIPGQQRTLDLDINTPFKILSVLQEGEELFEHGLQYPGSRNNSQFKLLYRFWRLNIPINQAVSITWKWIRKKHNNFSKTILTNPEVVKKEIDRQASLIYNNYDLSGNFPDTTNNLHYGYITNPDIPEIFRITRGNMPRAKFLFNIVKYYYPRRHRDFVNVHSKFLIEWSSNETYLKRLDELENMGVLKRGSAYQIDKFSKSIKLDWKFCSTDEAILYDGRAVDTLDDIIRLLYNPRDYRELLNVSGTLRKASHKIVKRTFDKWRKNRKQ